MSNPDFGGDVPEPDFNETEATEPQGDESEQELMGVASGDSGAAEPFLGVDPYRRNFAYDVDKPRAPGVTAEAAIHTRQAEVEARNQFSDDELNRQGSTFAGTHPSGD